VGGFPSESLDAFDRNQWMTCPEYADMPEGVSQICFWSFTRFPQPKIEIDQDPATKAFWLCQKSLSSEDSGPAAEGG